jgi:hypothetical protein
MVSSDDIITNTLEVNNSATINNLTAIGTIVGSMCSSICDIARHIYQADSILCRAQHAIYYYSYSYYYYYYYYYLYH